MNSNMNVTDSQMQTLNEFNRLDAAHWDRVAIRQGLDQMKLAIRQVLAKDTTCREDMFQLEKEFPGMTKIYAEAMGYSAVEFAQQLQQGVTLTPAIRASLTAMLTDPILFPFS